MLSCLACEAAGCACRGMCAACNCAGKGMAGRVGYSILFLFVAVIAWIFRSYAEDMLSWVPELSDIKKEADKENIHIVFGAMAVYRITFALALFHFVNAILMIGVSRRKDCRNGLNEGWWPLKIFFVFGLMVVSFMIPNKFFEVYGWIALIGAGMFIVVQIIYLVEFAHSLAEGLVSRMPEYETDGEGCSNPFWWLLLSICSVLYMATIAMVGVQYGIFAKYPEECQMNIWLITINLLACFVVTFMAVHPRVQEANPDSGILQASMVCVYTTYLILSALMSEPSEYGDPKQCNPWSTSDSANQTVIAVGAIFTIIVVVYSAFQAAHQVGSEGEGKPLLAPKDDIEEDAHHSDDDDDDDESGVPYNLSIFHLMFMLGAMYLGMLLSDWAIVDVRGENYASVDTGFASVWVKVVASWLCLALYCWTLVAPILLPDRDFK